MTIRLRHLRLTLVALVVIVLGYMIWLPTTDPVERHLRQPMSGLGRGARLRLVLLSDTHVAGPDNPPSRLRRIVARVNALHPDIVLLAGDFVTEAPNALRYFPPDQALEPFGGLRPRLATIGVLGNHDHNLDASAITGAARAAGVRLLDNQAVRVGPLVIGGLDDTHTRHSDLPATLAAMRALGPGARIMLAHSPDLFPRLPADVPLMLAGHTHCGQVVLPLWGPISIPSRWGRRYACGIIDERGRRLVVGAGIGTSALPLRLGAPPDLWVIDLIGTGRPREAALAERARVH